jgi:hypothetical protein
MMRNPVPRAVLAAFVVFASASAVSIYTLTPVSTPSYDL